MKFVDTAKVFVRSGNGGNGAMSFRREKFVEFGGPDGGDGGKGGDVWLKASADLNTLVDFRFRRKYVAKDGKSGMSRARTGADGEDIKLVIPAGTQVIDDDSGILLADLTDDGQTVLIARGGKGGLGNLRFKSSLNRAPRKSTPGEPGLQFNLFLKLKVIADVGLLGLPNSGKSTFLSVVSNARPKIADYPFTTLWPHLGAVAIEGFDFVIADIPGIIEGASQGRGLGDRFLQHIERCKLLVHLVDGTSEDLALDYCTVVNELVSYGAGIDQIRRITVLSKSDALGTEERKRKSSVLEKAAGVSVAPISSVRGEGIRALLEHIAGILEEMRMEAKLEARKWTPESR
ncbi:MAG: GTPase ObgE [Albidovulum sp.]|nr:GTPase ObgE [Albidovulum sp.]